jgi:adenine-specific DNA-methyltransferase
MARIDDLVALVEDPDLRRNLEAATAELKRQQRFGLVFEEHIPETTALLNFPIRAGATVQRRTDPSGKQLFRVADVQGEVAVVTNASGSDAAETCRVDELLVA